MRDMENKRFAKLPPVSAVSIALMIMNPSVDPNKRNSQQNAKINAASLLLLSKPIGKYQQQKTTTAISVFQTISIANMPSKNATQL
jgi:hypothetical protein